MRVSGVSQRRSIVFILEMKGLEDGDGIERKVSGGVLFIM